MKIVMLFVVAAFLSGCAAPLVLGLASSVIPADSSERDATKACEELKKAFETEIAANQVEIRQVQTRIKVTMLNEILFPERGYEVDAHGKQNLDKVVPTLLSLTGKRIDVNGYTDNARLGGALRKRFSSNSDLCCARAASVAKYLNQKGVGSQFLSSTGYGDQHPVASNGTPDGRQKNRRIEIVIADRNS